MSVVIIKYNAGNIRSVQFALERLGVAAIVSDNAEEILAADKVIFPGVGQAGAAMEHLVAQGLDNVIRELRQPVLGICLGMQLLCRFTEESNVPALGIFNTTVTRLSAPKVPHMGWNTIAATPSRLLKQMPAQSHAYFVHSYAAGICAATTAVTDYGQPFSSVLEQDNFFGVQFHPEKSAAVGAQLLSNFLEL